VAPALRQRWGVAEHEVLVVIARRLVAKNGVVIAAQAVQHTHPNVRFVFVGEGAERAAITEVLRNDGSAGRALLAGETPNDLMPEVYRAADIAVLPSLMEATSIAGLEAMACARAMVGSAVGGIPALIENGVNGLLVPPANPPALAAAINQIAEDAPLRSAMGEASRARVLAQFTWQGIAERTADVYQRVLARAPGRP